MTWKNWELKQVLVWASSCNMNSWINQFFPNKNYIHLSFQLHNKLIHTLSNLILQPIKFQEFCDNNIKWSEMTLITCQTTKKQKGWYLTARIKKQNISKSLYSWEQD